MREWLYVDDAAEAMFLATHVNCVTSPSTSVLERGCQLPMSLSASHLFLITMDASCTTGQSRTVRLIKRSMARAEKPRCWDGLPKRT